MQFQSLYRNIGSYIILVLLVTLFQSCENSKDTSFDLENNLPSNILDYKGSPSTPTDRSFLAFSDQGAWFAYSFPDKEEHFGGFSGPFLMTQENGVWSSPVLSQLQLIDINTNARINWSDFKVDQKSYNSHLEQVFLSENMIISQKLFFTSPHTTLIITSIKNKSNESLILQPTWNGTSFLGSLHFSQEKNLVKIISDKSDALGYIQVPETDPYSIQNSDSSYKIELESIELKPGETTDLLLTQSFIFPEYDFEHEQKQIERLFINYEKRLQLRILQKEKQLNILYSKMYTNWNSQEHKNLLTKTVLTLQNNWRIPTGELKHSGLFPSYHYIWFHGFWAWDSWKHAVALAHYDPDLAKEQIKAMYDFQTADGFIADCIYRDTTIENHNWRNTKPPLSAWAIWEVYKQSKDLRFLEELYPKVLKQHKWWYINRDHDKDGICEYGSTDGTLIAAKWESGMDNAVRFDDSKLLQTSENGYSLNQESVDLNAYLYAEKILLNKMATALQKSKEAETFNKGAETLKTKIQEQFFDDETGWFFDTSIDGKTFIKVKGCEGWIPLWAHAATPEQAEAVKNNMMNPELFFTKVPFQTLSANHPKFKPDGGYWRGPNWLDQAYFGVRGLKNYGFFSEANKASKRLFHNAEGVMEKGKSIRENYNPITGEGLEAENFSWSAAFYLLLLIDE